MACQPLATWEPPIPDIVVIFVVRCCAIIGYIIFGSAFLLLFHPMKKLCSICSATLRKAAMRNAHDELDAEASDMVSTFRARITWQFVVVLGIVHVPYAMNTLWSLHSEQVWGDFDVDTMRNAVLEHGIVQRFLRTVVLLLLIYRGHCSCFQLRILQAAVYCDLALRFWFASEILNVAERFAVSVLQRILLAFIIGHVPLTMVLNAGHCVGMCARVISSSYVNELQYILVVEVVTGVLTVGISALFEALLFRQMRATLEASLARESERTAKELLSLVCDAVVTLDDGLLIKKPSAQLAALLLKDTAQGLRGVDFTELVSDGDGDRFHAFMADSGRVQCLHLHLRDANGTSVAVQLFHSRHRGVGGKTFRLLGIREEGDGERTRRPPDAVMSHSAPTVQDVCHGTLREGGASDLSSQSSHNTVSSFSSGPSDSGDIRFAVDPRLLGIREEGDFERTRRPPDAATSHSAPAVQDVCHGTLRNGGASALSSQPSHHTVSFLSSGPSDSGDIAFAVDAASPRLTLMSCTPSFTALIDSECRDGLDWVVGDNAAELGRLVYLASIGARSRSAHVVFEVPHSLRVRKFRAWCTACILAQESRDGRVCVRVTLTEVRFRRRQRTSSITGTRRRPLQRLSL